MARRKAEKKLVELLHGQEPRIRQYVVKITGVAVGDTPMHIKRHIMEQAKPLAQQLEGSRKVEVNLSWKVGGPTKRGPKP